MADSDRNPSRKLPPPTLWQVAKSVMAAAFGVQKREVLERDFKYGKASQFIILGIIFTILLIFAVWCLVSLAIYLTGT